MQRGDVAGCNWKDKVQRNYKKARVDTLRIGRKLKEKSGKSFFYFILFFVII